MARRKIQRHQDGRRVRTTTIMVAMPTTIKEIADTYDINPSTVASRYHRVHDAYPNRVVTLDALINPHRRGPKPYMG